MLEWRSSIKTNNRSVFSADFSDPAGSGGAHLFCRKRL
jgi:hypothetical protein